MHCYAFRTLRLHPKAIANWKRMQRRRVLISKRLK